MYTRVLNFVLNAEKSRLLLSRNSIKNPDRVYLMKNVRKTVPRPDFYLQ